ncbi:MAG: biopolymer transporter ExbD [Pseudomonadales bacterium]|nr:biopolymer transporter ExbD [Pseudomonadales bacterium]
MARIKKVKEDAELDVTSFMNLMIVLVPVLLLNMVFAQTVVLEIKLPAAASAAIANKDVNKDIELIIRKDHMKLNYPAGVPNAEFPLKDGQHDFNGLSSFLKALKQNFAINDFEKKDILLLSEEETTYQTIVTAMDTVRSYEDVHINGVANFELFPDISLGDAPVLAKATAEPAVEGGAK